MIHTNTPEINNIPAFKHMYDLFYVATTKKMDNGNIKAFTLSELSSYGAIINIIKNNNEVEQLSKKKVRWSDLISEFFNVSYYEKKSIQHYKNELEKHALIVIKKEGEK